MALSYKEKSILNLDFVHTAIALLRSFCLGNCCNHSGIFIIDKNGVIRYVWTTEDPSVEPDYKEIEDALEKIG